MTVPTVGDRAPSVTLEGPSGPVHLADTYRDGPVVLAFFQEASTPACEAEVRGFCTEHDLVKELGARVLAVSTDPQEAQQRFAESLNAPFPVLTDPDGSDSRECHWGDQWHYPLARIAVTCRAFGLRPIDGPYGDFTDAEGYLAAARRSAVLGYEGKWAIHPSQVPLANEVGQHPLEFENP